ncbi:TRPM8 channel-associated factor homolog isoform X2 [Xenopus tropicalis]|uniref:TRPM8 channel-associated factor homolog isoform X2 n=1 Tax=Xenopus tropicalis TaxID=8364 RepID=A0A8J1J890_XENTR|nr:TRPM8 channel-associated factor homolog isoform X2 [Xenopus tropicalis]
MAADEDYQSLVRGVASLSFTGDAVPCKLLLTGPCAFPVLVSPRKDVLIAASRYGKGKVVVLAHEGYLNTEEFMAFLKNAVSWLSPNSDAVIGVHTTLPVLANNLSGAGYKVRKTSSLIQGLGVFCTNGYEAHQAEEIISFVRGGGGLLIGAQAWHWSCSHKENVLHHFPGNKIISVCGVHFTSEYGEKGDFWVTEEMPQVAVCTDYQSLVRGVASLSFTGDAVPCKLLLTGPCAFPVLVSPRKDVLIAASRYGKGKVVVLAHEGYLSTQEFMGFLNNAVSWLRPNPDAVIGVHTTLPVLAHNLSGYKVRNTSTLIQGLGVFCTNGYEAHQAEEIISFVRGGGGLLIGAQAWHWSYSHKENVLHHFPGNKIISVCGVHFTSEYGEKGDFWVTEEMPQVAVCTDYQSLVRGVASLSFTGDPVPCKLLLRKPTAFPVLVSPRKDVLIAASHYGKGKVVVLAHEGYLNTEEFMAFLKNAVSWLSPNSDAVIGVHTTLPVLANNLSGAGYKVRNTSTLIQGLGVFCTNGYEAHQAEEIISFVRGGGGLLIGAQAWHWSYSHKENVLHHFPGNKIISVCGVHFTSEYGEKGDFWVTDEMPQAPVCTENMAADEDYQSLVRGVASLSFTGDAVPCKLLLTGPCAFPVLVSPRKDVLIAASRYGKGKVVVLAHEGYLSTQEFMGFLKNAVSWLRPNPDAVIGVHTTLTLLAHNLFGYKIRNTSTLIQGLGVFCTNGYEAHQAEEIISFVRGGGGLLIGAQAWHWSYSHKENVLHHFPGNKIISVCGVHFTSEYGEKGDFWVTDEMPQAPVCTENMAADEDYQSLVRGVASLSFTGDAVPCKLLLTGPCAFPVLVSPRKDVLIAASRYGKGKVVVLAHEGYLSTQEFMGFLKNAVSWLRPNPDVIIGVHTTLPVLAHNLSGYKVRNTSTLIQGLGVFCTNGYEAHQAEEIISFVRGGGGLLIGAQAWHWSYSHKENVLHHFPGNKIISVCGVHFTSEYGEKGDFLVTEEMPQAPVCTDYDFSVGQKFLLNGVSQLDISGPSVPSDPLLHGASSFPVGSSEDQQCFVGAAYYGQGRVVVATHEDFLSKPELKTLMLNAISWLDVGQRRIGVHADLRGFAEVLQKENIPCRVSSLTPKLSVYCCPSYSDAEAKAVHQFVAEGGGLLIAGHAWWCSYQNSACNVLNYPGNKILNRFGISILCRAVPQGIYWAVSPNEASHQNNCHRALHHLQVALKSGTKLLQPISTRMRKLRQNVSAFMRHSACCVPNVSKTCPVSGCSEEALLLSLAHKSHNMSHKCDELSILEKETVTVNIDATNPGADAWRSTGLYLPPRKAVVIEFPASAVQQGFQVQVGCHSDDPSAKETLNRAPAVVRRIHVDRQKVPVSSFWGGLLYIIVRSNSNFGTVPVRVYGAEPAPIYIKGKTSLDSWLHSIRQLPAPWAELVAENIILTVPSDAVRSLKNPEALLSLWDRIMAAIADLAAKPKKFPRPERIVADVQISAGWMHAGYPIMCDLESAKELTDLHHMEKEGIWGPIHELGHNQQKTQWEFPPHTTEATCNLWAVYVHETVLGIPRDRAHGNLQPNVRTSRIKSYLQNGANLEQWDGWTALETYLQLQEGLGWDPFRRLYRDPSISGMSNENTFKMNLWAEKFSRAAQTNLVPFFEAWGWPIDQLTRSKLSALPVWEKDPMKPYVTAKKSV